jgi:Ca-activated chloride channel family protein
MMHFSAPWTLLLLLGLPLLFWRWGWQRRAAVPHPDLRLFDGLAASASWAARHGVEVLQALGMVCLVVALAGPRWPDERTRLNTDGIAILMAVDVSGSMAERDFFWDNEPITRLEAVQRLFALFVGGGKVGKAEFNGRPGDLVGLLRFARRPEVACPLTLHHKALLTTVEAEQVRGVAEESETNISDAIAYGLARLRPAGTRRKVLVLLTDGEHNVLDTKSGWSPRQAAQVAASLGVVIHTIDAGPGPDISGPGEPRESREAAISALKDIAAVTHGEYLPASDTKALAEAMRRIDAMERTPIVSFQYRRYHEGYPWFALSAFVLFVVSEALNRTLWRRLP